MSAHYLRRRPDRGILRDWGPAERRTLGIASLPRSRYRPAVALEYGRVWRRGPAPLPRDSDDLLLAAEEAAAEIGLAAAAGYGR